MIKIKVSKSTDVPQKTLVQQIKEGVTKQPIQLKELLFPKITLEK